MISLNVREKGEKVLYFPPGVNTAQQIVSSPTKLHNSVDTEDGSRSKQAQIKTRGRTRHNVEDNEACLRFGLLSDLSLSCLI